MIIQTLLDKLHQSVLLDMLRLKCKCGHVHTYSRSTGGFCVHVGSDGEVDCTCRKFRKANDPS